MMWLMYSNLEGPMCETYWRIGRSLKLICC